MKKCKDCKYILTKEDEIWLEDYPDFYPCCDNAFTNYGKSEPPDLNHSCELFEDK